MSKAIISSGLILMVVLLALVPVIGCAKEVAPPEEKLIKIGAFTDLTGPGSTSCTDIFRGVTDAVRYWNEEKGGIQGIKIKLVWIDDRTDPSIIISGYRRMKEAGVVSIVLSDSPEGMAINLFLNRDKIPALGGGAATSLFLDPGYYYCGYICGAQTNLVKNMWYYNEFKKKGLDRPMKLATVGLDNPYGREGLEPVIHWAEKEPGIEVIASLWVPLTSMDYTTELTLIKAKKPDAVAYVGYHGGIFCRDAGRVGLSEEIPLLIDSGGICVAAQVAMAGPEVVRVYSAHPLWTYSEEEDKPLMKLNTELQMRYHGNVWKSALCFGPFAGIMFTMFEAISRALDEVGYENLTGEAVKEYGLDTIKDWDSGVGGLISFGDYPGDRIAFEEFRIVRYDVANRWWMPVTDFIEAPSIFEIE